MVSAAVLAELIYWRREKRGVSRKRMFEGCESLEIIDLISGELKL